MEKNKSSFKSFFIQNIYILSADARPAHEEEQK